MSVGDSFLSCVFGPKTVPGVHCTEMVAGKYHTYITILEHLG